MPSPESFRVPPGESQRRADEEIDDYIAHGDAANHELPGRLQSTLDFADSAQEGELDQLYDNYTSAMVRRDREPLEHDNFMNHFFAEHQFERVIFGDNERGHVLGEYRRGVFIPSHFAPKTLRGGYELMRDLGESTTIPTVLGISEDLEKTIRKMPAWKNTGYSYAVMFKGESMKKSIVHNAHPQMKKLLLGLVAEFLSEQDSDRAAG